MKFVVVLIAALAMCQCSPVSLSGSSRNTRGLMEDFEEFIDLLPMEELFVIFERYLQDPEFQQAIDYLMSEEFLEVIMELETIPEYQAVMIFVERAAGLPVASSWAKKLHEALRVSKSDIVTGRNNMNDLFHEIWDVIDWAAMRQLYNTKMETSEQFKFFFEQLRSAEFKVLYKALVANQQYQQVLKNLIQKGIDTTFLLTKFENFLDLN